MAFGRTATVQDQFTKEVHVFDPHRASMPKLGPYVRGLWRRRQFSYELSRTTLKAQHYDTAFGKLWMLLNPLLLALVYYLLIDVLSGGSAKLKPGVPGLTFTHLLAGIFAFYFISGSMAAGAGSVTGSGRLILNSNFPRALLPLGQVLTAFMRFIWTIPIYLLAQLLLADKLLGWRAFGWHTLWVLPIFCCMIVFSAGLAMIFAALQVYFRDFASFLPYMIRIWLYLSPVLFFPGDLLAKFWKYRPIMLANPLFSIMGSWSDTLVGDRIRPVLGHKPNGAPIFGAQVYTAPHGPAMWMFGLAVAWSFVIFIVGALFFITREREFAVRL